MKEQRVCPWAKPVNLYCGTPGFLSKCYQCSIYRDLMKQRNAAKREEIRRRQEEARQITLWAAHVLPQTPRYQSDFWFRRVIMLKPDAMERHGFPAELRYQMFYATGGPGCRKDRPVGEIDGYFVFERLEETFLRSDFYGIPNQRGAEEYRLATGIDLNKFLRSQ